MGTSNSRIKSTFSAQHAHSDGNSGVLQNALIHICTENVHSPSVKYIEMKSDRDPDTRNGFLHFTRSADRPSEIEPVYQLAQRHRDDQFCARDIPVHDQGKYSPIDDGKRQNFLQQMTTGRKRCYPFSPWSWLRKFKIRHGRSFQLDWETEKLYENFR